MVAETSGKSQHAWVQHHVQARDYIIILGELFTCSLPSFPQGKVEVVIIPSSWD